MLKPSFNFDRLKEEARFRRQRIVKICLSPYHMASNEPDTLYSNTHTYLDFCPLFKVTQLLDCRSRSFLTINLGTHPTCFFSSVWTFKFHSWILSSVFLYPYYLICYWAQGLIPQPDKLELFCFVKPEFMKFWFTTSREVPLSWWKESRVTEVMKPWLQNSFSWFLASLYLNFIPWMKGGKSACLDYLLVLF